MTPIEPIENDAQTEDQVPDDDNDGTAFPPPPVPQGFADES